MPFLGWTQRGPDLSNIGYTKALTGDLSSSLWLADIETFSSRLAIRPITMQNSSGQSPLFMYPFFYRIGPPWPDECSYQYATQVWWSHHLTLWTFIEECSNADRYLYRCALLTYLKNSSTSGSKCTTKTASASNWRTTTSSEPAPPLLDRDSILTFYWLY